MARRCPLAFLVVLVALLAGPVSGLSAAAAAPSSPRAMPQVEAVSEPADSVEPDSYQSAPEPIGEMLRRDKNLATLDVVSPDGSHFLVGHDTELSTLERMSRRTLRLAMLEIRPDVDRLWHHDTFGLDGLRLYSLDDRTFTEVALPADTFVSDFGFSPDGTRLAFLAHEPDATHVWVTDVASGRTSRLSRARVLATLATRAQRAGPYVSQMLQWTDRGTVLTVLVPDDRGPEPEENRVPEAPIIRRTRDGAKPTSTTPFLLQGDHDRALLRHYTRGQIAELGAGMSPRPVGEPAMFTGFSLSPDGAHLLAERIAGPLSELVDWRSFGRRLEVLDLDGDVVSTVRETPLREGRRRGDDPLRDLPREVAWIPGTGDLGMLWREPAPEKDDGEDEDTKRLDRIIRLSAPFDPDAAVVVATSEEGFSDLAFTEGGDLAVVAETVRTNGKTRRQRAAFSPGDPEPARIALTALYDDEDPLVDPGDPLATRSGNGVAAVLRSSDGAFYLQGTGYRDDFHPQPFIDRVVLEATPDDDIAARTTRVFEGASDTWDVPLVPLDPDLTRMIVSREGPTTAPDSWLWTLDSGFADNLTNSVDPFPELTAARRVEFTFTRRDGFEIEGHITLPIGYEEGTRVPAMFWTYPREFEDEKGYRNEAVESRVYSSFPRVQYLRWSTFWLTQGYALVHPDVPIIGDPYNDNFISHLSDSVYAAIRKVDELGFVDVDRIGHGGHSYGAFATANLLAHTPYFKAGIAGNGAYNRTLTPMTFQSEPRFIWQAQDVYLEMSPFFSADHIDTPLLMYHGADDNNTGTWPIQSVRLMQALTGLGKEAVLYLYPYESHSPRSIETYEDFWARWIDWFDRYVKNAGAEGE